MSNLSLCEGDGESHRISHGFSCPMCHSPLSIHSKPVPTEPSLASTHDSRASSDHFSIVCQKCSWTSVQADGLVWIFRNPQLRLTQWSERIDDTIDREKKRQAIINDSFFRDLPQTNILPRLKATEKRMAEGLLASKAETCFLEDLQGKLKFFSKYLALQKKDKLPTEDRLTSSMAKAFFSPEFKPQGNQQTNRFEVTSYSQTLDSYKTNIFRDWGWPHCHENTFLLQSVLNIVNHTPSSALNNLGEVLLLGTGPGRLLCDLAHHSWPQSYGIKGFSGLDINPSLLYICQQMMAKRTITLHETILCPPSSTPHKTIPYQLHPPETYQFPPPIPINLWCGDWTEGPFSPSSWGLIISPWFFDILPQSPEQSLRQVTKILRPGGLWFFIGSTAFLWGSLKDQWSRQEWLLGVKEAGLNIFFEEEVEINYLQSPNECQTRREKILIFGAMKPRESPDIKTLENAPDDPPSWPIWLTQHELPIPLLDAFKSSAHHHKLLSLTLGLVDGKRSIRDMAHLIAQPAGISIDLAIQSVAHFLQAFWELNQNRQSNT